MIAICIYKQVLTSGNASMKEGKPECVVEAVPEDPSRPDGPTDLYLVFDGKRIAKRGKPGTLHAMTWISLEPGVVVRDVPMAETMSYIVPGSGFISITSMEALGMLRCG